MFSDLHPGCKGPDEKGEIESVPTGKLYCSEVALSYHAASIDHPKFHDDRIENKIK